MRPHSQGPSTLLGSSSGGLGKGSSNGLSIHNQSTGSIGLQQNTVSVHHASPASPTLQSVMTLPIQCQSSNVCIELKILEYSILFYFIFYLYLCVDEQSS